MTIAHWLIIALLFSCVLEALVISRQSQQLDDLSDKLFEAQEPLSPIVTEPIWDYTREQGWRDE